MKKLLLVLSVTAISSLGARDITIEFSKDSTPLTGNEKVILDASTLNDSQDTQEVKGSGKLTIDDSQSKFISLTFTKRAQQAGKFDLVSLEVPVESNVNHFNIKNKLTGNKMDVEIKALNNNVFYSTASANFYF